MLCNNNKCIKPSWVSLLLVCSTRALYTVHLELVTFDIKFSHLSKGLDCAGFAGILSTRKKQKYCINLCFKISIFMAL